MGREEKQIQCPYQCFIAVSSTTAVHLHIKNISCRFLQHKQIYTILQIFFL